MLRIGADVYRDTQLIPRKLEEIPAEPARPDLPADGGPSGLEDGTPVTVTPDDSGRDPVAGVLAAPATTWSRPDGGPGPAKGGSRSPQAA